MGVELTRSNNTILASADHGRAITLKLGVIEFIYPTFLFAEISPKGKRKLDFPKKNKSSVKLPLTGKTLYLDVKDIKCTRRLETALKKLGGVSLF